MYYACLEFKKDKHDQNGIRVEKKSFENRDDARAYIAENFNPEIHSKCWTE